MLFFAFGKSRLFFILFCENAEHSQAVGVCQRAISVSAIPRNGSLWPGLGAVALPAFSQQVRKGNTLKESYLGAIAHITGLQWPALVSLALLAHPVVLLLLGSQWLETVPLIEVICVALLFYFPIGLNNPLLVAVGAIRLLPLLVFFQAIISLGALALAARYGLRAAVLSMLLSVPLNVFLSVLLVRHYVCFAWSELWHAMHKSAAVTVISAAGPLAVAIGSLGRRLDLSIGSAALASALALFGWLFGVWATRHPLWPEVQRARCKILGLSLVRDKQYASIAARDDSVELLELSAVGRSDEAFAGKVRMVPATASIYWNIG